MFRAFAPGRRRPYVAAAGTPDPTTHVAQWREYAGDMGNTPSRDGGTPDPTGGTDCAHPTVGGADLAEGATTTDQYANRHNPFIYFHSIIDNQPLCSANEVPLGTVQSSGTPAPTGHLVSNLSSVSTTPMFGFVTPNTCDDGHDVDVCRAQRQRDARRWPGGGRRLVAALDAHHPELSRLPAGQHARRGDLRRVGAHGR